MYSYLSRPKNWVGKNYARVAFIGHALLPGFLSSEQISSSLKRVGRDWPDDADHPGFVRWISFPVYPLVEGLGRPVWVDFYVVPVYAPRFFEAIATNEAYGWVEGAAEYAILRDAQPDDVDLVIGWGAFTKMATQHGLLFVNRRPEFMANPRISTTHGDAGSAALAIEAVRLSGSKKPRLAIIGANGAIGGAVSRAASLVDPEFVVLVGKADRKGEEVNLGRLRQHQKVVEECVGGKFPVYIHQDKRKACLEYKVNTVIAATGGAACLKPQEVDPGTLILDVATPPACSEEDDWSGRMVISAGCGQFVDLKALSHGFGDSIWDCGAGGERVLWGCAGETIARAMFRWKGHLVGQNIPTEELSWCLEHFAKIGFAPQPPTSFGKLLTWSDVRSFVCK